MKKYFALLGICLISLLSYPIYAQSTMTDSQVLQYVKDGLKQGKNQKTLMQELVLRGVDRAQAERVKKLYESQNGGEAGVTAIEQTAVNRSIKQPNSEDAEVLDPTITIESTAERQEALPEGEDVFGRNIFRNRALNFAPSENLATPRNYKLGPGDEVVIDIFGANQTTLRAVISNEGSINVDLLGPLYLNGKSIEEANNYLRKRLSTIYAGLESEDDATDIVLTLGQIRSIQVNVLGDVTNPGTYSISSLSTAFHALFLAGGVQEPGSLRNIKVTRGGKTISNIDVYDFIMNGNRKSDIRLEEGDVIIVPSYNNIVKLSGMVKRPMNFEIKDGETLQSVINYAGGFAKSAYTNSITIVRQNGHDYEVRNVDSEDFASFKLQNGDEIEVGKLHSRFENRISLKGAVYHEGLYELSTKIFSVKTLIEKSGGLLPEAFTSRAVLHRERTDRSLEILSVDIDGIMKGTSQDIILRNNDALFIPSIYDMKNQGTLTISGEVVSPGTYPFASNTSLEDLVLMAGGVKDGASLVRVDISRRIMDNNGTTAQNEISRMYSFSLKEGFVVDGTPGFILEPYDEVIVRRSPSYAMQKYVSVSGEINFSGSFPITSRDQRISELIKQAGGVTEFAYTKGARLTRRMNATERKQMQDFIDRASMSSDSAGITMDDLGNVYYVAINLDKAITNPGSEYDIVLREGDHLEIPVYSNTVRVSGAVQMPNAITYSNGKSAKYYIDEAGGYSDKARKRHVYVVHMNGHVSRANHGKVEPGSEIIVPTKTKEPMNLQGYLSIGTTAASMATMVATIANILKK